MSRRLDVRRRPLAEIDILEIALYLDERSAAVARKFLEAMQTTTQRIAEFPASGDFVAAANSRLQGCRAWPVDGFENWRIYYLERQDAIDIVRVLHVARDLDSLE